MRGLLGFQATKPSILLKAPVLERVCINAYCHCLKATEEKFSPTLGSETISDHGNFKSYKKCFLFQVKGSFSFLRYSDFCPDFLVLPVNVRITKIS